MKFTLSWLKQHLDTKASVEAIAETLTRIGLEVEELFDPETALKPFRVAEVVKCDEASQRRQAASLRGRYRQRALAGGVRRAECAGRHEGRVRAGGRLRARHRPHADQGQDQGRRVERHAAVGARARALRRAYAASSSSTPRPRSAAPPPTALGLDDAVIEVAITPNRPDCLGVRGIARDLAAAGSRQAEEGHGQAGQRRLRQSDPDRARVRQGQRRRLPGLRRARWCAGSRTARAPTGCSGG